MTKILNKDYHNLNNTNSEINIFISLSKSPSQVSECFRYYEQKLKDWPKNQERPIILKNAMFNFLKLFIPFFGNNLDDSSIINNGFEFINLSLFFGKIDKDLLNLLCFFTIKLLKCNNKITIDKSFDFLNEMFIDKDFEDLIFSPIYLSELIICLFMVNNNPHSEYLMRLLKNHEFRNTNYNNCIQSIINNINLINDYFQLFNSIGIIISKSNSQNFLNELLHQIELHLDSFKSFDFFENYLNTSRQEVWEFYGKLIKLPNLKIELLLSSILILNKFLNNKYINLIPINEYIKRAKEIPLDYQKKILLIINKFPKPQQLLFFKNSVPNWETGISSYIIKELGIEIDKTDEIIQCFIYKHDLNDLSDHIQNDENLGELLFYLSKKIDMNDINYLTSLLLELVSRNISYAKKSLLYILRKSSTLQLMPVIFNAFERKIINTNTLELLSEFALENNDFVEFFLKSGIHLLFESLKSKDDLIFLISIVCDGPYQDIDKYIELHFNETILSSLNEDELLSISMGIPLESHTYGSLRIPSLLKYINVPNFDLPYDRYIYSTIGVNYNEKSNKEYCIQYIDKNSNISDLINNADLVNKMTDLNIPFHSIYQSHFDMPHSYATFRGDAYVSFWFFISNLKGKFILFQIEQIGNIYFDCDGISFFNDNNCDSCSFHQWHNITISQNEKSSVIQCYLDGKMAYENKGLINYNMQFGSEYLNNGIWFLYSDVKVTNKILSSNEIYSLYLEGLPINKNESNVQLKNMQGFKYVPYNGIGNYIDAIGGEEFIFIKLFEAKIKEDFIKLFKAAFNLYMKKIIEVNFFLNSLKFIFYQKPSFICDEIIFCFIETFSGYEYTKIFTDYQLIPLQNIDFKFLPRLFRTKYDFSELLQILIDCYLFIELNENTQNYILESIQIYVKSNPLYLEKLILFISASDKDNIKIFQIVNDNCISFFSKTTFSNVLELISVVQSNYALILFIKLTDYTILNMNYLSHRGLKRQKYFLYSIINKKEMWICILSLVVMKRYYRLDDFICSKAKDIIILKIALDMLSYLIRVELQQNPETLDLLSFKILTILTSIAPIEQILQFKKQIINLATLGYNNLPYQRLPYDENMSKYLVKRNYDYNNFTLIKPLSENLYSYTISYLQSIEMEDVKENHDTIIIPDLLPQIIKTRYVLIIAKFTALAMIKELNESIIIGKTFFQYTIFGCDVSPIIAMEMHPLIIIEVLKMNHELSDDVMNSFFEFLTIRINENWSIFYLKEIIINSISAMRIKTKSAKNFIVIILSKIGSNKDILTILMKLFNVEVFLFYLKDLTFFSTIKYFIYKIKDENEFDKLKQKVINTIDNEFIESLKKGKINEWFCENYNQGSQSEIQKICANSIQTIRQIRIDITNSRLKKRSYEQYKNQQVININLIKKAYEFQIFYRLNENNWEIEQAISRIFLQKFRIDLFINQPSKFMIGSNPHPLSTPLKMIPLVYNFNLSITRSTYNLEIPTSIHVFPYNTSLKKLLVPRNAPYCFKNWNLPAYSAIGITYLLKSKFEVDPQQCYFMTTPEIMSSIYFLTKDTFYVLLNASIENDQIILKEGSKMLCHFASFELPNYGYYGTSTLFCHHNIIYFKYDDALLVIPRRYSHNNISVDIFLKNGINHTIVFSSEIERDIFISKIKNKLQTKEHSNFGINYAISLISSSIEDVYKKWINQDISTLDYLIYLNVVSGRSFHDLSQYPIFPWVLGDFDKDIPMATRDLSKTMGNQTKSRAEKFIETYREMNYHFGTHYSHPAGILHYMLRIEPFTLFSFHLHNGLDHKDRIFCSINEAWKSSSCSNQADVKELIPQFYDFPEMYENPNGLDLQSRTDGQQLNTILLPKWCKNSIDFIYEMRKSLEKSEKINLWIDLIFGYKQSGKSAVDSLNVFHPLSYISILKDSKCYFKNKKCDVDYINNFGQCPLQLFTFPHLPQQKKNKYTIFNCEPYLTNLKSQSPNPYFIQIVNNELKIDQISKDECYSTDYQYIAKIVKNRYIIVSSVSGSIIQKIIIFNFHISKIAFSSQHFLICAADNNIILLFDVSTGCFIKKIFLNDLVLQILFDEVYNIIFVITKFSIHCLRLNLKEICSTNLTIPIHCMSTCSSNLWKENPFILIGFENGTFSVYKVNINLFQFEYVRTFYTQYNYPIACISTFDNDQFSIIANTNGDLFLLSVPNIRHKIINSKYFERCSNCLLESQNSMFYCSICGLFYCKSCRYKYLPNICVRCSLLPSSNV